MKINKRSTRARRNSACSVRPPHVHPEAVPLGSHPLSPPSSCVSSALRLFAFECPFSFFLFNFQPSNLLAFKLRRPNSFPHNPLSDPRPLNPVVSILYKNGGGKRPGFSLSSRAKRGICFFLTSLVRCFFASLLQFSERFNHVSQTHHFS